MELLRKHKITILVVLILLLAAFLRLYRIGDYMTFLGDEGRDLLEVRKILRGDLVFLGPRSSAADFYYGPIYFYFITPFLLLANYDPVGPAIFIALLGIGTVYLVYYVGEKLFNQATGLFAAALYAVSPLVISYSRSSWNPNPLPFVSLLSLYVVYHAVQRNSWRLFFLTGLLLGIAIQLQYLAIFLGFIVFLFILIGFFLVQKRWHVLLLLKQYVTVAGGFLVGWSPFLAFEIKNGFPNLNTIYSYMLFGNAERVYVDNGGFIANIQHMVFRLFARLVTKFPQPETVNVNEHLDLRIWQIATCILAAAAILALYKTKNKLTVLLFTLWFFIGVGMFGFYRKALYDYYLGFMFPLPFLLVGNLLGILFTEKRLRLYGKVVAISLFSFLFLFNLYGNPFRFEPNRQKDQVKMIAEFVLSKTDNKPYNFALLTGGNSDHAYRYYLELNKRPPVELKNLEIDPERKSVTEQLLVICEDPVQCHPLGSGLWEIAGFGQAEIAGDWRVSVVRVLRLVHYKETPQEK